LTGDPKVQEGDNVVSGDEIVFDIEKDRVEVKGGSGGRGKARFIPKRKPKRENESRLLSAFYLLPSGLRGFPRKYDC